MKKHKLVEIVMDCLVFCLLAGSLSSAFLKAIHVPVSAAQVLLMTLSIFFVLRIVLWNKWTAIVILSLASLIGFIIVYRMPEPLKWLNSIVSYLNWQITYICGMTHYIESYTLSTAWLWTSLIGLVYFIGVVKLRQLIIPSAIGTGLIFVLWFLGHRGILTSIWLFALGAILLWGGASHKKLSSQFSLPHYGLWQLYVLPLAIVIILTAKAVFPADTGYTWPFLVDTVEKIDDHFSDRFGFSGPRQPFRLTETGFPSSHDRLGGPVNISDGLVLEVSSSMPLRLRGSLLNEYVSTGWRDTIVDTRYRFSDLAWDRIRQNVYNFNEKIWDDLSGDELNEIFPEVETIISHVGIETSAIFHPLQPYDIRVTKGDYTPYFNTKGETFATREIHAGEYYTLKSRVPIISHPRLVQYLMGEAPSLDWSQDLPEYLAANPSYGEKLLAIQEHYMRIPDSVPQRVLDLTDELVRDKKTSYEKILAIQDYLQTSFTYTLKPPYTPISRDFVDYFLFDLEEGYCTYFASAMAVMGRAAGLPTRYVEGFIMPTLPNPRGIYEVKKLNGHAWVEVYFPQVGWLPFDPTPPGALRESTGQQVVSDSYINDPYWEWEEEMDEEVQDIYIPDLSNIDNQGSSVSREVLMMRIALFALLIIVGLTLMFTAGLSLRYKLYWKGIKKLPLQEQFHILYKEILWILKLYGSPIKQGETPYSYARRVDEWMVNQAGSMMDVSSILISSEFGGRELNSEDLELIQGVYKDLKDNIRDVMGYSEYLILLIKRIFTYRIQKVKR